MKVDIMRHGLGMPCPVPVLPGTPTTMIDGEPVSIEQRTEACAVNAYWMLGGQLVCCVHLKEACGLLEIDWDSVLDDPNVPPHAREVAEVPWAERKRYSQTEVVRGTPGGMNRTGDA